MCGSASGALTSSRSRRLCVIDSQVVDGVQLAPGLVRVVHAGDAGEDLEAQRRVVQQLVRDREQVLAAHVEGQLAAVHHDPLDRLAEAAPVGRERGAERLGHRVEVAAVGRLGDEGRQPVHLELAVPGGVRGAVHAEHAGADHRRVEALLALPGRQRSFSSASSAGGSPPGPGLGGPGGACHSSLPRSLIPALTCSGSMFSRASSSSVISSSRSGPSFMFRILSCSLKIASISISGRGGQPGR